jgi:gas vesicle protein
MKKQNIKALVRAAALCLAALYTANSHCWSLSGLANSAKNSLKSATSAVKEAATQINTSASQLKQAVAEAQKEGQEDFANKLSKASADMQKLQSEILTTLDDAQADALEIKDIVFDIATLK